jgi:hypothetical protein
VNAGQAARLRGHLSARYPGSLVDVTPGADGARIVLSYQSGGYLHITTGNRPGVVLPAMLDADLGAVDDGTA